MCPSQSSSNHGMVDPRFRHSQHGDEDNRIHHNSSNDNHNNNGHNRKNGTAMLRGAMIFHRVGEFAILAVIAIAVTTIPFSFLLPRVYTAHAFCPITSITRSSRSSSSTGALHPSRVSLPLGAAELDAPPTASQATPEASKIPRLSPSHLQTLREKGLLVVPGFLTSAAWMEALRDDVRNLRSKQKFRVARIGQDATNALNQEIRVAETCFLGRTKPELKDVHNQSREKLYDLLEQLRIDLQDHHAEGTRLDPSLSEFLYAYYPKGGFYRRHRDAVRGSASWLREYSLLLYLNEETYDTDEGRLRVHLDSGGDFLPAGEKPNFVDVDAAPGTLVVFESDQFPHEVLDTAAERFAVVGWYNRPMSLADLSAINNNNSNNANAPALAEDPVRLVGLAVAAGLVTVGVLNLLAS